MGFNPTAAGLAGDLFRQYIPLQMSGNLSTIVPTVGTAPDCIKNAIMISNERASPYGYRPPTPYRAPVREDTLKYAQLLIEQTSFVFTLKQNPRGRFLRITEKTGDDHVCLIIPDTGLEIFREVLGKMFQAAEKTPAAADPAAKTIFTTEQVQVERKSFLFELGQDPGGRFVRIIENARGRANDLIIPTSGLEAFNNLMDEMIQEANEHPPLPDIAKTEGQPWVPPTEEVLQTGQMQLERKSFTFSLRKNARGRFLRITEEKDGHYNNLIISAEGLEEFKKWVADMAKASKKIKK